MDIMMAEKYRDIFAFEVYFEIKSTRLAFTQIGAGGW